ncbi:hypothetical protein E3E12_02640 [Formicincola oecophyllae]|uniref:Uncharacterized protein n=1 Tax=Formicincola oecophyllae TaxID=2558361 RepID=A0A4Y6U7I7_9PROT|nr:hypothetical protein [Formicincola oecophyllae]QDH13282.1 hypothetical protein E3E12_02640 [Formicincola oecophyllae]
MERVRVDGWDSVQPQDSHPGKSFFRGTENYRNRLSGANLSVVLPNWPGQANALGVVGVVNVFYVGYMLAGVG